MFAEMPLDNVTVNKICGHRRQTSTCLVPCGNLQYIARGNDLKFRRGCQFCNIEPKIRQYD